MLHFPFIVSTFQVIQTMQVPLSYAEDIIGIQGNNIAYIRRTSGAILTVQESRVPDEIIVEIKGTTSQVQMAQQLIQVGGLNGPYLIFKNFWCCEIMSYISANV